MTSTQITIVGNLTDAPEFRITPGGVAAARFSVAVNRRQYDKATGAYKDAGTDFHRVQAWRDLAENIGDTFGKGMRVIVSDTLEQSHWTDEKTGEKKSAWIVTATAAGPDLAWATAKVTKSKRNSGDAPDSQWDNGTSAPAPDWANAQ